MAVKRAPDRRVLRTRRTLHQALVSLILERGWDEISVLDVCDRANVGRSTFYVHFGDKEDLLLSGFDELKHELRMHHSGEGVLSFAAELIEHARDNQRLFRALIGKKSALAVQRRFRQLVVEMISEDLSRIAPRTPDLEATVHYLAGAYVELLMWWLDARTTLDSTDIARLFHRRTEPILAQLGYSEKR
jgi:AcrR family transcriptional regulator